MLARFGAIALATALTSCATGTPLPEITAEIAKTYHSESDILVPGDVLDIRFKVIEWNHTTRVRADGKASFLGIDDILAAGKTVAQLTQLLTAQYTGVLAQPTVSVLLTTLAMREVVVMGEVQKPGSIPVDRGRLTLIDAIGRAGGPIASTCLLENTVLIRWIPEEQRQVVWIIDASPEQWESGPSLYLQPYDVVFVPNKRIVKVDIWVEQHITRLIPIPGGTPIYSAAGG